MTRALPEPKVSGSTVTYPDAVAPGADLVVIAQGDGFVSQMVFRRKPEGHGWAVASPKRTWVQLFCSELAGQAVRMYRSW